MRTPVLLPLLGLTALLAVSAAQGQGTPEAPPTRVDNPHSRADACGACHDAATPDGAVGAARPSVENCLACHPDADMHPVNVVPSEVEVPGDWVLEDGKVVCATCHAEPSCDAERSREVPWFRGGPVQETKEFCFRCHDASGYARQDPHHPEGEEDTTCSACHSGNPRSDASPIDSRLRVSPGRVCAECHESPIHRGVLAHLGIVMKPEQAATLPADLPLDSTGAIQCWTCHDVHGDVGEVNAARLAPREARASRALKDLARAGHPPAAKRDAAHPALLALPITNDALCSACHGDGG